MIGRLQNEWTKALESDLVLFPPQPSARHRKFSSGPPPELSCRAPPAPLSSPRSPLPSTCILAHPGAFRTPLPPQEGHLTQGPAPPSLWVSRSCQPTTKGPTASPSLAHGLENTLGVGRGRQVAPRPPPVVRTQHCSPADGATFGVLQGRRPWEGSGWHCPDLPAPRSHSGLREPTQPSPPRPEGC